MYARGFAAFLLVLAALAGTLVVGLTPADAAPRDPVVAQVQLQRQDQGGGFFLFRFLHNMSRPRGTVVMEPPPGTTVRGSGNPGQAGQGQQRPRASSQAKKRARAAAPRPAPEPEVAAVEKSPDAEQVLVIGDFMAASLAKGLTDAYADNPGVVIRDETNGSSGLVKRDRFDWAAQVKALTDEAKPAAIVVMVGANDRQTIDTDTGPYVLGSDDWPKAYGTRVAALADALKAAGKPAFWGSLVPVRSGAMTRDYGAMNTVVHDALDGSGLSFVDLWNGFADDDGRFMRSGPDVNGQTVQLRSSDGINFTRAGQRKLAFFVQQELNAVLKNGTLTAAGAASLAASVGAGGPAQPQIGPMVPIDALLSEGGELATNASAGTSGDVGAAVIGRLGAAKAPALRADSYSAN